MDTEPPKVPKFPLTNENETMKKRLTLIISAFPFGQAIAHESMAPHRHLADGAVFFQSALTPVLWLVAIAGAFMLLRWLTKSPRK